MRDLGEKQHQPSIDYEDSVIFGPQYEVNKWLERNRSADDSECIIYGIGTFADKKHWNIKNLIGNDRRLKSMLTGLNVSHTFPIQRFSWPKLQNSSFPIICVSPEKTGKTYAYLLYIVTKSIAAFPNSKIDDLIACDNKFEFQSSLSTQLEDLTTSIKFIVICSSHHQTDFLSRELDRMKEHAYGPRATESKRSHLPPIVKTVNVHHDDEKLTMRCNEAEVLVATPGSLIKCLRLNLIDLSKCKKVFIDDMDQVLQLHNYNMREIMKIYIRQTILSVPDMRTASAGTAQPVDTSQMYLFSRKWTDLVQQFVSGMFPQRTLIFGSIAEAAIYAKTRFDIELCQDDASKISKLHDLILLLTNSKGKDKLVVACCSRREVEEVRIRLEELGHKVKILDMNRSANQNSKPKLGVKQYLIVHLISDEAISVELECSRVNRALNDMTHIIHYSMPNNLSMFDQRFRLMYNGLQVAEKSTASTIFLEPKCDSKTAKQLFDLLSRSSTTLKSTKLLLRDFIGRDSKVICWRWATTGLCRLEKLSREDRFGSFCHDCHFLASPEPPNRWPRSGQVKISITHIVSPNEFYFWFEAHRDIDHKNWKKFSESGCEYMGALQRNLDSCKDDKVRSVPLERIKKGQIYGIYLQQEARVDRVLLLDEPKHETDLVRNRQLKSSILRINEDLEYSRQVPVIKIDYGSRIDIYIKNIIELPPEISSIKPQCHRAFHLGVKPTDGEPYWLHRAKKHFYESINVKNLHEVTAWLRLNSNNCFWFENMIVSKRTYNIDFNEIVKCGPHSDLCRAGLAESTQAEPACLLPSVTLQTIAKWNCDAIVQHAQFAHLRRDRDHLDIFLLNIWNQFNATIRQTPYNKQLIDLESSLSKANSEGLLKPLKYISKDVYCIVKLQEQVSPDASKTIQTFNRAVIMADPREFEDRENLERLGTQTESYHLVKCLDHGDIMMVNEGQLFQATSEHLRTLPFQAIACKLAYFSQDLIDDRAGYLRVKNLIIDITRDQNNMMKELKCRVDQNNHLHLYIPNEDKTLFVPLPVVMSEMYNIAFDEIKDAEFMEPIVAGPSLLECDFDKLAERRGYVLKTMLSILEDIVGEEMNASSATAQS